MCSIDCGKQDFWEVASEITSPHYPDNYENYLSCHYYIQNPFNNLLTITFEAFNVEYSSECDSDYLKVSMHVRWCSVPYFPNFPYFQFLYFPTCLEGLCVIITRGGRGFLGPHPRKFKKIKNGIIYFHILLP